MDHLLKSRLGSAYGMRHTGGITVVVQQDLEAKEKEIQLFKSEIKSLQDIVDRQKNTETKKVTEVSSKITDYQAKLAKAEAEVTKMKQDHAAQDLTFRVIQERLVFTTNEAEKYKLLAQEKITQERLNQSYLTSNDLSQSVNRMKTH